MKIIFTFIFFLASCIYLKFNKKQRENNLLVIHSNSKLAKFFKMITEHFLEVHAGNFLFTGHVQTILIEFYDLICKIFKKYMKVFKFKFYRRDVFTLSDGGSLAIDIAEKNHDINIFNNFNDNSHKNNLTNMKNKILIIVPGYTSNSDEYYIKNFVNDFVDEFDCRVMNVRGFAGKLTSPFMISTHCYKDVREYLEFTCSTNPDKKVFAVGFSFGGMLLARCLGSEPEKIPKNFFGACGICYPMCLKSTKNYVEPQLGGLYSMYTAIKLKKLFFENIDIIFHESYSSIMKQFHQDKEYIINKMKNLKRVYEFDEIYTYKILNFESHEHYYEDSKLEKYISNIKIPFLSIFNKDDPIIPCNSIPLKIFQQNPNLVTIISKKGGHMGFFKGLIPQQWIDVPIKTFMKTVEIMHDVEDETNKFNFQNNNNYSCAELINFQR